MTPSTSILIDEFSHDFISGSFSDDIWDDLTEMIRNVFSFDKAKFTGMRKNPVLKLIGAMPYLANCDEPARTALSHMTVFILAGSASTKEIFSHNFKDSADLERRLERISHFPGGDERIIDRGMKLLSLAMIADHINDLDNDNRFNKLNPVGDGHWDAEEIMMSLRKMLHDNPCPEMDRIISPADPPGFWDL